jgi:hypothetical protein
MGPVAVLYTYISAHGIKVIPVPIYKFAPQAALIAEPLVDAVTEVCVAYAPGSNKNIAANCVLDERNCVTVFFNL